MILAAAVCPHPPLLVPEVAPGTSADLNDLRAACADAVRTLLERHPARVVVIGAADDGQVWAGDRDESAGGTLAPYGAGIRAGGGSDDLPLSLTIGAWLLDEAGWTGPRTYSTGRPATGADGDVVVLVMADGTNSRSLKAPGFLDERAESFDAVVAAALAAGDAAALQALDPDLGTELGAAGVAALRTLGELVVDQAAQDQAQKGAAVTAHLRYDGAPLGVGYFVADWTF